MRRGLSVVRRLASLMSQENQSFPQLPTSESCTRLESDIAAAQGFNALGNSKQHHLQVLYSSSCEAAHETQIQKDNSRTDPEGARSVNSTKTRDDDKQQKRLEYPSYGGLTLPVAGSLSNTVGCKAFAIPPSVVLKRALSNEPVEGSKLKFDVTSFEISREESSSYSRLTDTSDADEVVACLDSPDLVMYSVSETQSVPMPVESTYFGTKEDTPVASKPVSHHKQDSSDHIRTQRKRKVVRQKQRQRKQKATEGVKITETNSSTIESPVAMEVDSRNEPPVLKSEESVNQSGTDQTSAEGEALPGFVSVISMPPNDTDGKTEKERSETLKRKKSKRRARGSGKWQPFPTHFIGIQVAEQNIHDLVTEIQTDIVNKDERLCRANVPPETLHVTLKVLSLKENDQIKLACETMQSCSDVLEPLHLNEDPLTLEFKGLGNFRNQVLFVSVEKGPNLDRLKTLADLINQHFIAAGLTPCDSHQVYSAHMTVMKLSRMKRTLMKKFKPRKINPELYSQWADTKFGSSIVKDIQLLQMSQKDENGFYKCISKINVFGDGTSPGPTGSMYTSTPCNKEGQRMEHESATSLGSSKIKFDEPSDAAMTEDREELVMEYSDTLSQMNNEVQVEAEEPQTGVEQVSGQTKNSTEQALISDLEAERGNCLVTDREDVMKKLTECVMAPTTEETNAEESMQVIEITGNEEIIKQQESTEELVPQYVDAMSTEEGVMHPPTENIEIETENQTGIAFAEAEERMNAVSEKVQIVGEVKETEDDVSEYQSEESALDTAHPVTCVQAEVVKDAANSKDEMTVSGTVEELCEEVTIQESSDNAIDTSNIISDLTSEETATGMVKELRNEVICQEAEKGINITEDSASEIIKQTEQALNLEGEETSAVMVEELQTEIAGNNADEIGNTECNMNQTSDQLKGMSESKVRETAEILAEEELHKDVSCPIDDQIGATENGIEIDQVKTKLESAAKQTLTGIVTQFDEGMTCPETDEPVNLTEHQPDKANNQNETVKTALTEMVELHDEVSQGDLANIVGESKSQSSNESLMELNSVAKKIHEVVPCSEIDEPVDIMEHQTGKANNHNQIESLESMIKAAMVELHEDETSQGESASVVEESKHQASNTGEIKVTETDASESLMASNSDAGTDQSQVGDIKPAPVIQDDMTDSENYDDIPETGEDFIHLSFKETEV